jgi:quinolinate synthase
MLVISHNFQTGATQELSDFVLGTTGIVRKASSFAGEQVLFCGVLYMAEDLFIMSDGKAEVFLPEIVVKGGVISRPRCPMISKQAGSDIITMKHVEEARQIKPDIIMSYINTPASVKAEVDGVYNGTVGLAVIERIARENDGKGKVVFIGDHNVNGWIRASTKDKYPDLEVISIPKEGVHCPSHLAIPTELFAETYSTLIQEFGQEKVGLELHPEVDETLRVFGLEKKAYFGGTGGLVSTPSKSQRNIWLVGTVEGVIDRLNRETNNDIYSMGVLCPNMSFTSSKKVKRAKTLLEDGGEVAEIVYKFRDEPYYEINIIRKEHVRTVNDTQYLPAVKLNVSKDIATRAKKSLSALL